MSDDVSTGAIYRGWCVSAATSEAEGGTGDGLWQDKLKIYETMNETSAHWRRQDAPGRVYACACVCMCVSPLLPPLSLSLSLKIIQLWPRLSLDASRPIGGGGIAGDISKYHRSLRDLLRRVYRRRDRGDVMSPSVRCKRNSARISSLVNANVYGRLVVPS